MQKKFQLPEVIKPREATMHSDMMQREEGWRRRKGIVLLLLLLAGMLLLGAQMQMAADAGLWQPSLGLFSQGWDSVPPAAAAPAAAMVAQASLTPGHGGAGPGLRVRRFDDGGSLRPLAGFIWNGIFEV